MALVDLDLVVRPGETVYTAADSLIEDLNISYDLKNEDGGGGWPVVRFAGSDEDVETLLRRYDGGA